MTKTDEMAEQFRESIVNKLGLKVAETIFENKTIPKDPVKRAKLVKEAISNLDKLTNNEAVYEIMRNNGINCANHNIGIVNNAIKRRAKFSTLEAFIESEIKKPVKGTSLERDGGSLILSYLPKNFSHPMRCFCALVNSLPSEENISETYCKCSVGFVETWWSKVIGKRVNVKLLESAITGSDKCRFRITW